MDSNCTSFNYHINKRICVLNNANRADSNIDFVSLRGSVYYDGNLQTPSFSTPTDASFSTCLMFAKAGYLTNGVYTIYPDAPTDRLLQVYCDMKTDGGGWIVIQRRQDGSGNFHRSWADYQSGFGDLQNEFWLGNDILRDLTGAGQWQLRVDLEDWEGKTYWATYGEFAVWGNKYTLSVGYYSADSTEGDSMIPQNGVPFSTGDRDNDKSGGDCASTYEGAWWFDNCFKAHLNGKYYYGGDQGGYGHGIQWYYNRGWSYSFKKCDMKIREVLN